MFLVGLTLMQMYDFIYYCNSFLSGPEVLHLHCHGTEAGLVGLDGSEKMTP